MPIPAPLHLPARDFRFLLEHQGPSLGLWRAAEIAALREQHYAPPVLDLGCGDGLVASQVLPHVHIGLDPDPQALARAARRRLYGRLAPVPVEASRIAPGSIGTVLSNSVLEHLPCLEPAVRAVAAMLRPGGRLVFTVPTGAFSTQLALPFSRYAAWRNGHYAHLNLWPLERWVWQLDRVGLAVERARPYLRAPLVAVWDVLELLQRVSVGRHRLFGLAWRRLPGARLDQLARRLAAVDLSAPPPGGGCLIVARKR